MPQNRRRLLAAISSTTSGMGRIRTLPPKNLWTEQKAQLKGQPREVWKYP